MISCVSATALILEGAVPGRSGLWWPEQLTTYVTMLSVYGLVFTTLSLMLFDFVIEE